MQLICFGYRKYRRNKDQCPLDVNQDVEEQQNDTNYNTINKALPFGPWMQVLSFTRGGRAKGKLPEPIKTKENMVGSSFSMLEYQEANEAVLVNGYNPASLRPPLKPIENTICRSFMNSETKKGKEKVNLVVTKKHPIQIPFATIMPPTDLSQQNNSVNKKILRKSVPPSIEQSIMQEGGNIELEVSKNKRAFATVNWDVDDSNGLIDDYNGV